MSPSATPARKVKQIHAKSRGARQTQARHQSQPSAVSATPAMQSEGRCHQVPRLPRQVKVDVITCCACHANSRDARQTQVCHQSQPSAVSATPATQSESLCRQVLRLPRKQPRRPPDLSAPPEPAQCHKCHASHAK